MRGVLLSIVAALALLPHSSRSQTATQAADTVDRAALDAAREVLAARRTKNILVLQHGKVVYEWYAPDSGPRTRHYTASLAKAIVGGMSLLLALQDGRIALDDPASKYISAWKNDPRRSRITIRHLATHSSGIEDAEQDDIPHDKLPGWKGAFWKREPDPFTIALRDAPVVFDPGTRYAYSNPGMAALAYAVTASLQRAPQRDIQTLLKERILGPLGVGDDEWSIGYGRVYDVDGMKLYANWGGGAFTAPAVARIGQLLLQRGKWGDRELIDARWIARATAHAGTPRPARAENDPAPGSGLAWWTNDDGVWSSVPRDAFAGAGAGHQVLLVIPSLDLVVVRNGGLLREANEPTPFWWAIEKYVFNPVVKAATAKHDDRPKQDAPYPESKTITRVIWAPVAEIVRAANGSDNWPNTWADDDALYTAYGDGWGFEPNYEFVERIDDAGRPVWTADVSRRGAIFTHAQHCYRTQVSYHPWLKRYLLCQILPAGDARFEGGFGVYEAPEPWGPWSTVYFTRRWDVGPGESCSFPTKWMDPKGAYMLFSGNDSFSVRKVAFEPARMAPVRLQ